MNNMMKQSDTLPRMVASDIGGTLVQGVAPLPSFTAAVLDRLIKNGVPVALVTGYNYSTTKKFVSDLDERIILMPQNGALCIRENQLVWEHRIPEPEAKGLCAFLAENNLPIIIYKGKNEDFANYYIFRKELPLSYAFQRVDGLEDFENISGISTLLPDELAKEVKIKLQDIVGDRFKVIYSRVSKGSWLEVVNTDVRKDLALARLCEYLQIPLADVIYFGDNFNDLEALRLVGYPVVVENAQPELKAEFATIIDGVDREGAARYLNDLFNLGL